MRLNVIPRNFFSFPESGLIYPRFSPEKERKNLPVFLSLSKSLRLKIITLVDAFLEEPFWLLRKNRTGVLRGRF